MTGLAAVGILRQAPLITSTSRQHETGSRAPARAGRSASGVALAWLILAALSFVSDGNAADAVTAKTQHDDNASASHRAQEWTFSRVDDVNFDEWPDEWQRKKGIRYPNYVKIKIVSHDADLESRVQSLDTAMVKAWPQFREMFPSLGSLPPSIADSILDRFLLVQLNGGNAAVQSPSIPTSQLFQYRFTCRIMTEGLKHDTAHASLVFLDAKDREVLVLNTPLTTGTTAWQTLQIDRVRPPQQATTMCVRLTVVGSEDGTQDINGRIGIDDIRIEPFPQLQITTNQRFGIYNVGQPIVATAKLLGMPVDTSIVEFRLLDHRGTELSRNRSPVSSELKDQARIEPTATWELPELAPGFYRIASSFSGDRSTSLETETTVAVIESLGRKGKAGESLSGSAAADGDGVDDRGPFGWSLPRGSQGIDSRELVDWLARLGVAWLKYPVWTSPEDAAGLERNATLMSRLQTAGIQTVGVLSTPPAADLPSYEIASPGDAVAANLFRDPAVWKPRLEPIMNQLSLKVRKFQIGADDDHSFLGRPRLQELISVIRSGLQGFGQAIQVTISWPWTEPTLLSNEATWQAANRTSSNTPMTADELDAFLDGEAKEASGRGPQTWLCLDPIDADRYDRNTRISDMVMRMAAVQKHPIELATIRDPFDARHGLLREDGRPSDLLLPWRTTSLLLGGTRYVGALQMQNDSNNQVFAGADRAVLMVWSPTPRVEEIYLGEDVRQVDVWGRVTPVPMIQHAGHPAQQIVTGPMPIFLIGVDATLLAFRMSVAIAETELDSYLGQVQPLNVVYTNPTRDAMVGEMRIQHPESWQVDAPTRGWELLGGTSATQTFDVVLGNTALIGEYEIALNFQFQTTPAKEITVYRKVNVGVRGLSVKLTSRVTESDELQVTMEMTNATSRSLSYDCMLFPPPGRQYQRRYVRAAPNETTTRDFFFSGGRELAGGRMLLRAIEQDGRRVLNYEAEVAP